MAENSYVLISPSEIHNGIFYGTDDSYFFLLGEGASLNLFGQSDGNAAFVFGHKGSVVIDGSKADRVGDHGQGSTITVGQGYEPLLSPQSAGPFEISQLWNFQNDASGVINVRSPWDRIASDGHGGTLISFLNGSLDVIGDPNAGSHVHLASF
jgi:hypothetical protein